jgi:hypothetical protein
LLNFLMYPIIYVSSLAISPQSLIWWKFKILMRIEHGTAVIETVSDSLNETMLNLKWSCKHSNEYGMNYRKFKLQKICSQHFYKRVLSEQKLENKNAIVETNNNMDNGRQPCNHNITEEMFFIIWQSVLRLKFWEIVRRRPRS